MLGRYLMVPYGIPVYYTHDWEEYQQAREDFGMSRLDSGSLGITTTFSLDNRRAFLIYWNHDPSILVHECSHVVFGAFEYVGIRNPAECDNEPFAYSMDHLFSHIWTEFQNGKAQDEKPQGGDLPANGTGGADSDDPEPAASDAAG